jgi:hypothetical protein
VIKTLRNKSPKWSPNGQIIANARGVLHTRQNGMVTHVKIEANSAAHHLAKDVLSSSQDRI